MLQDANGFTLCKSKKRRERRRAAEQSGASASQWSEEAQMIGGFLTSVAAAAVATAALVGTAAVAAEAPKDMIFANKFAVTAKVLQASGIGKNGEAFVLIDENTTVAMVPITRCNA
jgi:hypothetical protein